MNWKELVSELRSMESRSKRELLDNAADAIENLHESLVHCLRLSSDCCTYCIHGREPQPCESVETMGCDECELHCRCSDCVQGDNKFEWNGRMPDKEGAL